MYNDRAPGGGLIMRLTLTTFSGAFHFIHAFEVCQSGGVFGSACAAFGPERNRVKILVIVLVIAKLSSFSFIADWQFQGERLMKRSRENGIFQHSARLIVGRSLHFSACATTHTNLPALVDSICVHALDFKNLTSFV